MNFKTHIAFGLLCGLFTIGFFNANPYLFFSIVIAGTLIPDMDHPNSKIGKKLGIFSKIFNFIFGHRGITHSLLFPLIITMIIFSLVGLEYAAPFAIGYLSHIVIDALTKKGVNFFYPLAKLRISGFIETGSIGEWVVFLLIIAGITIKIVGIIL